MKKRVHKFEISVTFDKYCHKSQALLEVKDAIYKGFHFAHGVAYGDADIGQFRVQTVKNAKLNVHPENEA